MSFFASLDALFTKKDVDESPASISHNPIFLVAIAALVGYVVWKASGILTLPFFIVVASLIALGAILYFGLHFASTYFGYKLTSERQKLLLADGKVDAGDLEAIKSGDALVAGTGQTLTATVQAGQAVSASVVPRP